MSWCNTRHCGVEEKERGDGLETQSERDGVDELYSWREMEKETGASRLDPEVHSAWNIMNLSFKEARRRDGAAADGQSVGKGKDLIHDQILSIYF